MLISKTNPDASDLCPYFENDVLFVLFVLGPKFILQHGNNYSKYTAGREEQRAVHQNQMVWCTEPWSPHHRVRHWDGLNSKKKNCSKFLQHNKS